MQLTFNVRHLERQDVRLQGEVPADALDLADVDELVKLADPVRFDLAIERLGESVLVRGNLRARLACQCSRCLREFDQQLDLTDWACDLPLTGDEKVQIHNDCVDLTPYVREDILLAFPQHPLCEPGCRGLLEAGRNLRDSGSVDEQAGGMPSAWSELNKLKF